MKMSIKKFFYTSVVMMMDRLFLNEDGYKDLNPPTHTLFVTIFSEHESCELQFR